MHATSNFILWECKAPCKLIPLRCTHADTQSNTREAGEFYPLETKFLERLASSEISRKATHNPAIRIIGRLNAWGIRSHYRWHTNQHRACSWRVRGPRWKGEEGTFYLPCRYCSHSTPRRRPAYNGCHSNCYVFFLNKQSHKLNCSFFPATDVMEISNLP